jgi:flagellar biosynthesis protein FlhB
VSDSGQRTEQPTQRKLHQAREKGQFPASKDFVGGMQFALFVALLIGFSGPALNALLKMFRYFLQVAFTGDLTQDRVVELVYTALTGRLSQLAVMGLVLVAGTLATHLVVTNFGIATTKLAPDFKRLNPASRLRELPRQNISSAIQGIILLPLLLYAVWVVVTPHVGEFLAIPLGSVESGVGHLGGVVRDLLQKAALALFVLGCIDLYRQKKKYNADMRMTKQEVRDEHKEVEGNPQIKQRIRRLQRDAARRNMMKELPNATAVVVNPTHFAVALQYDMDTMGAPRVVAKGKNYLALRIREKATEYNIPIVENPPLAQALYKSVDVGQEIPAHLYRAVAEILAYIFRLTHGKPPGQR